MYKRNLTFELDQWKSSVYRYPKAVKRFSVRIIDFQLV